MKEKIESIKAALEYQKNMALNGLASHRDCIYGSCVEALTTLESLQSLQADIASEEKELESRLYVAFTDVADDLALRGFEPYLTIGTRKRLAVVAIKILGN